MSKTQAYSDKLERMEESTLLPVLAAHDGAAVRRLANDYRLTFQELRRVGSHVPGRLEDPGAQRFHIPRETGSAKGRPRFEESFSDSRVTTDRAEQRRRIIQAKLCSHVAGIVGKGDFHRDVVVY